MMINRKFNRAGLVCLALIIATIGAYAQTPKAKWAEYDNVKIRYYDIGNKKSATALVLVHCWTCNVEFWKDNYNAFPEYRVIAMDLPGHGQSDKPKIDYSMEFFAKSVDAVMNKAGAKKAVFAGHSMGTPIIRKYYELYPEKTLGLIVVDGALLPFGPRDEVDKFFEPLFKDYKTGVPAFVDSMLPTVEANLKSFIRVSMLATPDHVGTSAMKQMLDDAYATHGKINIPVLATMAPSPFWPKDMEQQYKTLAPNMEFRMWDGVSHFLHMEKPKEFNEQVRLFISKNKLL
jgi:pimeloyl-ACP methyl ester carboxylesterase